MGVIYAIFMSVGWLLIRVPAEGWKPAGWDAATQKAGSLISTAHVSAANAIKTPQFWLLWVVLCFTVTAGIGILAKASPIYQDYHLAAGPHGRGRRVRRHPVPRDHAHHELEQDRVVCSA